MSRWKKHLCLLAAALCAIAMTALAEAPLLVPEFSDFIDGGAGTVEAFSAVRPDVPVEIAQGGSAPDISRLVQEMTLQDGSMDVLWLMMQTRGYAAVRDRGYCAGLESSEALRQYVDGMYPAIADGLWQEEKLCAIPVKILLRTAAFNRDAMEALGLGEDDLPGSVSELLDFIAGWDSDAPVALTEYDPTTTRRLLFCLIRDAQESWCAAQGKPLTYDDPTFIALLEKLDAAMPALRASQGMEGRLSLLRPFVDPTPSLWNQTANTQPLLLARVPDEAPHIKAYVDLYAVNPYSGQQEAAVAFLECAVRSAANAPLMDILLHPDRNDLIESAAYRGEMPDLLSLLARQEEALRNPDLSGDERLQWELSAEDTRARMAQLEAVRWVTSPEALAQWRMFAQHIVVPMFSGDTDELNSLTDRYLDGQLSPAQFAREAEGVLWMIQQE